MGKKQSVVLMTILTIVIVVLCALTIFPAFAIPGTVKNWNPAVLQYDLGTDLNGGYYAYYLPKGVITETEYKDSVAAYEAAVEEAEAEFAAGKLKQKDLDKIKDECEEYKSLYVTVDGVNGLYFSTADDANDDSYIVDDNGALTDAFKASFEAASKEIAARYAKKGYDDYRVAVVNGYSIRVELPASETTVNTSAEANAQQTISLFSRMGEFVLNRDGALVTELEDEDASIKDLVQSVSVKTQYEVAYLNIEFTEAGREIVKAYKEALTASSSDSSKTTSLEFVLNGEPLMSITADHIDDSHNIKVKYPVANEEDIRYVETLSILLNSALANEKGFDIEFENVAADQIREFAAVSGSNTMTLVFIGLFAVLVALIVFGIVKMGKFGVVNMYATVSYLIITGLCFAFISQGVFTVSFGTILMFLIGLVAINVFNLITYDAIKKECDLGKTVESSVKAGYNKTLGNTIDVYAVALLGALAFLIGGAGMHTVALQAIICVVTAAFCNLLWGRFINFVFLSAHQDKDKYFRVVREEEEDDE